MVFEKNCFMKCFGILCNKTSAGLAMMVLSLVFFSSQAKAFDHSHQKWNDVLRQYVSGGNFKYSALKTHLGQKKAKEFTDYLQQLASVSAKDYELFSRHQQMAFLINAYNAMTIKLIVDHYPVRSIKDIGSWFKKPWSIEFFQLLGGAIKSIDPIEHDFLRPKFKDYRIHAAVNCASKSCPVLRQEAFQPDRLDEQLDEQMTRWLVDQSKNTIDPSSKIIYLSKIFDWYAKDFETWGEGLPKVLMKHAPDTYKMATAAGFNIKYLEYDWGLNDSVENK